MVTIVSTEKVQNCKNWLDYFYNFYLPGKPFKSIEKKLTGIIKVLDVYLSSGAEKIESDELNQCFTSYFDLIDDIEDYFSIVKENTLENEDRDIYLNIKQLYSVICDNTVIKTMRYLNNGAPVLNSVAPEVKVQKKIFNPLLDEEPIEVEKAPVQPEPAVREIKGTTSDIPNYLNGLNELFDALADTGISLDDSDEYFAVRKNITNASETLLEAKPDEIPDLFDSIGAELRNCFDSYKSTFNEATLDDTTISRIIILNKIEYLFKLFKNGYAYNSGDGIYFRFFGQLFMHRFVLGMKNNPDNQEFKNALLDADTLYKSGEELQKTKPFKQVHGKPLSPQDVLKLISMPQNSSYDIVVKSLGKDPLEFCTVYNHLLKK